MKSTELYQTPITRKNISLNCKTYQSSEVDSHNSSNAITPPYSLGSKTRREVDPWYEVDLGKTLHVHSVSLTVKGPTQQHVRTSSPSLGSPITLSLPPSRAQVSLYVLLLKGPVGFENPFLDRSETSSPDCLLLLSLILSSHSLSVNEDAVCSHVVHLTCNVIPKLEEVEFTFPSQSIGGAIRIQLKGLQALHIFRLQVCGCPSRLHSHHLSLSRCFRAIK
jgi:hypothetical protein